MTNSVIFNFRRNAGSDWISLAEVGREFQACDAAAGNGLKTVLSLLKSRRNPRFTWFLVKISGKCGVETYLKL